MYDNDEHEILTDALIALNKTLDSIEKANKKKHDDYIDALISSYNHLSYYCKNHKGTDYVHCKDNGCIFCEEIPEPICTQYRCIIHNMQYENKVLNIEEK